LPPRARCSDPSPAIFPKVLRPVEHHHGRFRAEGHEPDTPPPFWLLFFFRLGLLPLLGAGRSGIFSSSPCCFFEIAAVPLPICELFLSIPFPRSVSLRSFPPRKIRFVCSCCPQHVFLIVPFRASQRAPLVWGTPSLYTPPRA